MEVIFFGFVVSAYNTKYKKKKSQLFRLTNSVTLSQLKMSHACIKKQIPSVCRWCKYLIGGRKGGAGGKKSCGHFWKHRKSMLNLFS